MQILLIGTSRSDASWTNVDAINVGSDLDTN